MDSQCRLAHATRLSAAIAALMTMSGCRSTVLPAGEPDITRGRAVRLVTTDIPAFWRAYDAMAGRDSATRVRLMEELYLRPGSPGLRDMIRLRLMDRRTVAQRVTAAGWSDARRTAAGAQPAGSPSRDSLDHLVAGLAEHSAAEGLVATLAQYPRYFAAVRASTLAIDTSTVVTSVVHRGLARLEALYPEARFPDVYFLIGNLSTGGTVGPSGMLIGTEQQAAGPDVPRDELPAWARSALASASLTNLGSLVVHEAVHTQQPERRATHLLDAVLHEGIADFLSELAVGPWNADTERARYGRAHEREVWMDFRDEMYADSTIRTWLSNGNVAPPKNHGANNIGYWVGYRIAKAYYEHAPDKPAAVRELILLSYPQRILDESRYAAYVESLK